MRLALHYENATARSLGFARAVVYSLWLFLFIRSLIFTVEIPAELYVPRGLVRILPDSIVSLISSPRFLSWFPWLFIPVVLAAALGLRPYRLWGPFAFGLILVLDIWSKGFSGFAYHAWLLPLTMAGVMAFSPAADGFALWNGGEIQGSSVSYRIPLLITLTAALFCYSFIGLYRLVHGDYRIFTGGALHAWLIVRSQEPSVWGFQFGTMIANSPYLFGIYRLGFVVTTLLEAMSLLCLYSRRFAFMWLGVMLIFHICSLFTLNIFFWENTVLLPVLFLPLGLWMHSSGEARPSAPPHAQMV